MTAARQGMRGLWLLLLPALAANVAAAQQEPPGPKPPTATGKEPPYQLTYLLGEAGTDEDYWETRFTGGFRLSWPSLHLEILGQSGLVLADRDEVEVLLARRHRDDLPRRGVVPPEPRRRLGPEILRQRLESFLRAAHKPAELPPPGARTDQAWRLPRFLYFEGGVIVVRDGVEVMRCDRLWISPLDDRMVLEGVELRYLTTDQKGQTRTLTVRGARLLKQGTRWTGRNLTLTSCTAGEPHTSILCAELQIVEHGDQFELIAVDDWLQFSGHNVLPLPDAHFFSGEQNEFPLRGASGGYSQLEGAQLKVDLGMHWNGLGGSLHNFFTGRPASEFRGDWQASVGWIEKRGYPLEGRLAYKAAGQYEGHTDAFWLDDSGHNIRDITANLDGSTIDETNRTMVRTQNRVTLGETTHLDLSAFHAGDPAVYPEFYQGDFHDRQLPETSLYLHHADGNTLLTIDGRFNLDGFSYKDNRALADRFTEERPVATYQVVAQKLGELPGGTPIVLDTATELGQRRSNFADLAPAPVDDRTFRGDQLLELSTPFDLGVLRVRPYADVRLTWYDQTTLDRADTRLAYESGVRLATRMSHVYGDGDSAMRHVIAPHVEYEDRFHVDGDPSLFNQFDDVDALTESNRVRVGVRNLFERMDGKPGARIAKDVLFVDVTQNFWPNAARDNSGHELGLLEYDVRARPELHWLPFSTFGFAVKGEHDWQDGMRTFDGEVRVGKILGFDWTTDYRADRVVGGAVGLGASTQMFERWNLFGASQYDLSRDAFLHYTIGLQRVDHDWTIQSSINYDPFSAKLSFAVTFTPRLGGLLQPRDNNWFAGQHLYSAGSATDY